MLKADLIDTRLRALSHDEIHGVAGGDIVVNGYPPSGGDNWWDRMPMFSYDYSNGIFSGGGGGGGGWGGGSTEPNPEPELVDTDGDGIPDSEEIVVTATPHNGGDYCSNSPDSLFGVDISYACLMHDLRYGSGSDYDRVAADRLLLTDILQTLTESGVSQTAAEYAAGSYWLAVRQYGASHYQGYGEP